MKKVITILSVAVALLLFSSFIQTREIIKLQGRVVTLEGYKDHFIRLFNNRDYPEVLEKSKEKKNDKGN